MADLLLLPSPLLGPATWAPAAALLDARISELDGAATPDAVLAAYERAAAGLRDPVLVPHSNAGLYAPVLAERVGARAVVYVDAALPGPGPETALAPARFRAFLHGLVEEDGLLPPWTQWWEEAAVRFPDEASRAAVEAQQPRLPLSYFDARVPVPRGWAARPSAYVAFGGTYAAEAAFALAQGWPLVTLAADHLHLLTAPAEVAATVAALAGRLTGAG